MKLTKAQKTVQAKEFAEKLKSAPHLFFTGYQGLKFLELDELRAKLRPLRCRYAVMKNSLVRYALKQAGLEGQDKQLLKGPVAMVVSEIDDPVAPAKVLAAFAKQHPLLKIKAGLVSQKWITPAECQKLSNLGSKPELLGQLAGVLYSSVAQSARVLQAPIRDLVLVLKALEEKQKGAPAKN